ncbi:MAG: TonB-dependent receptor, partial [Deltaproteobacteria bacterium HGW-Deltaproteobacteria-24]
MKKRVCLSLLCATVLCANESVVVDSIHVNETITSKVVKNVSSEQIKSADLAEALSKNVSSVSLVRRSGIANDILLRGQKRDNINVLIDGAKIYGACPNRMDPPTSHILSNNVESVVVNEGPFDVENFGTLSGMVNVVTKAPQKGVHGEINLNAGSFGYKKASGTISGGNEFVKALISISKEESKQYKDGNGDTFYEQQVKSAPFANQYKTIYKDMDAYEKKTLLTKLYFNLTDDQDLKLSYTANRSDNILYPNTGMDAIKDDSDIYTLGYTVRKLGELSKELNVDYYYSKVEHPMSTLYRNASSGMMGAMVNDMESKIQGFKIKNSMDVNSALLSYGIDTSKRSWEGEYSNKNGYIRDSISPTDTKNKALFAKYENDFEAFNLSAGVRYDDTSIQTDSTLQDNEYNAFSGNLFSTFNADENTKYFLGMGKSVRVPDARELYNISSTGATVGTPTLDQTKNYE